MVISAKGTRLNRRGLQTRRQLLEVAIVCLAAHDAADPASANQIAREAGVTWGTVQHQFGDVDGLWAAVLGLILDEWELLPAPSDPSPRDAPEATADRVAAVIDRFWNLLGTPRARAVNNLRTLLPGDRSELESAYPRTAAAIADWDRVWTASYEGAFAGLPLNSDRLRRVRIFLPGALRGLREEFEMSTYADESEGRRGLVEAVAIYLTTDNSQVDSAESDTAGGLSSTRTCSLSSARDVPPDRKTPDRKPQTEKPQTENRRGDERMTAAVDSVSLYRELESELTGPQGPFALTTIDVAGEPMRVYRETPASLDDVLRGLTDTYADSVLLIEEGVEYTYRDVAEMAERLAAALSSDYRIEAGQRVGVIMRNQLAFVVSVMAIARRGAVAVLFNSRETPGQIGAAVADASCVVVIADQTRAALVRESDVLAELIVVGEELPAGPARAYADLVATGSVSGEPAAVTADSPCLILFTSGTSGRSKGVVLTQRNVCTMIMNLRLIKEMNIAVNARKYGMEVDALRDLMPKLSALLIFPLFHTSGLVSLLTTMTSGGFVVILRRWDPAAAIEMISRHKLAMLAGPPMVITDLLSVNPPAEAVSSLVNISPAGQATPPDLVARIGAVLPSAGRSVGWGMTEATGSICTAGGDLLAAHPDSSGPVSPVMDVRVVDPAGIALSQGEIGELQARGPLIMAGYLDRPDETSAVFDGSWYRTGDLGYVDTNGLVFVVDRKKDIVISAGENVYCAEVEYALMASGLFVEVAVFGVPHERLGETVVAVVNTRDGREMTTAEVQDIVRETLAEYKIPTNVVFDLGPLPRNATGKILKRKVREAYPG